MLSSTIAPVSSAISQCSCAVGSFPENGVPTRLQPASARRACSRFRARAEKPLDQLKLRHVRLSVCRLCVCGVADEVEPRDAESRLVDRVVEQRKSVFYVAPCRSWRSASAAPEDGAAESGSCAVQCRPPRRRGIHNRDCVQNKSPLSDMLPPYTCPAPPCSICAP